MDTVGAAFRLTEVLRGLGLHALVQPDLLTPESLAAQFDAVLKPAVPV